MTTPEGIVEKYLFKQCKKLDVMCLKFATPSTTGVPDRLLVINGWTVFLELKRPEGTLRRLQEEVTDIMRDHGADVRFADTKEKVDDLLAELISNPRPFPASTVLSAGAKTTRKRTPFTPKSSGRLPVG